MRAAIVLAVMVRIPAGAFVMGGGDEPDEGPARRVFVRAFEIDRDEVTRADYLRCVAAGKCAAPDAPDPPDAPDDAPITGVSWRDAANYCRFVAKRLPSEAEWEKAARGSDGRIYPWGNTPDCAQANFGNYQGEGRCPQNPGRPVSVGKFPGASPYGVRDLAGNVWEWTADYYERARKKGDQRVVRGGACCSMLGLPRASNRLAFPEDYRDNDLGFRCARDLK